MKILSITLTKRVESEIHEEDHGGSVLCDSKYLGLISVSQLHCLRALYTAKSTRPMLCVITKVERHNLCPLLITKVVTCPFFKHWHMFVAQGGMHDVGNLA